MPFDSLHLPYVLTKFLFDFKHDWQRDVILTVMREDNNISFVVHGSIARRYNKSVTDVVKFSKFLVQIGFMTLENFHYVVIKDFVPKNQREPKFIVKSQGI